MNANFEKIKKYIVIGLFVFASILSLIFMGKVAINYNISDYLDEKTETKISLNILEDEFGMTADVQVMIENISVDKAKQVKAILKDVENVLTVSFDENSADYYKNGNALFVILVDGDEYSQKANDVVKDVKQALNGVIEETTYYGGGVVEKATLRKAIQTEIPFVLGVSLCLVVAIMLLTSKSWIEPLVLLLASGVAVLINMGTNVLFGEISYITNAVAAILQLALSVDYSIVLLHSYRKFKAKEKDSHAAMNKAVKDVVKPVSASALTTMAGLFALLFMSMKIGFDIGTVLMKGIVVSAIVSLTLFPALLLIFEKPLERTKKKELIIKGRAFYRISLKAGKKIICIALAVIIACGALQFGNTYTFTDSKKTNSIINDAFGRNNSVVVVYENTQDSHEKENALIEKLNAYKTSDGRGILKSYTAYSNTVREIYDIDLAAQKLQISRTDLEMLYTMYHLYRNSGRVTLNTFDFIEYADELLRNDPDASAFASEGLVKAMSIMLAVNEMMNAENTAEDFQSFATTGALEGVELDLFPIKQMYGLHQYDKLSGATMNFKTMVNFVISALEKPELDGIVNKDIAGALEMLVVIDEMMNGRYTAEGFHELITTGALADVELDLFPIKQLYGLYGYDSITNKSMGVRTLVDFVVDALEKPELSGLVNEDVASALALLPLLDSLMSGNHTAEEFHALLTSGTLEGVEMDLFPIKQMYGLYGYDSIENKSMTVKTLVDFVVAALEKPELSGLVNEDIAKAAGLLPLLDRVMNGEHTAEEFHSIITTGALEGLVELDLFPIKQMYGLYNYDSIPEKSVDFMTMVEFLVAAAKSPELEGMMDQEAIDALQMLLDGGTMLDTPLTQKEFQQFTKAYGVDLSPVAIAGIYGLYKVFNPGTGNAIPPIDLIKFAVENGFDIGSAESIISAYETMKQSYTYEEFMPALMKIAKDFTGETMDVGVSDDTVQQLYIMYFFEQGVIPDSKISGRTFIEFIKATAETNDIVGSQLPQEASAMLADITVVDEFLNNPTSYEFEEMSEEMLALLNDVQSVDISGALEDTSVVTDAIQQLYIMYLYEQGEVPEIKISGREFVQFIMDTAETNVIVGAQLPESANAMLSDVVVVDEFLNDVGSYEFEEMSAKMVALLSDVQSVDISEALEDTSVVDCAIQQLYIMYLYEQGEVPEIEISGREFVQFIMDTAETNVIIGAQLPENVGALLSDLIVVDAFLQDTNSYEFEQMSTELVALLDSLESVDLSSVLGDDNSKLSVMEDAIQQIYIMYLYDEAVISADIKILGREFVEFIKATAETNVIVGAQLPEGVDALLSDISVVDEFLSDANAYDFKQMATEMTELQTNIQSMAMSSTLDSDKILGVYVKYAVANDNAITDAIEAKDLLAFVLENVDSNEFLSSKLTADKREKLSEAQEAMASGTALLVGENYSRILLSIDLESESSESSAFVEYLLASVKDVFGEKAHVAGEMVSTYDLQTTFDTDNVIITIFTIISIFLIVMLVFRSVSLPILLVAIIQGAIWITMATSLLTGPMFFMSYIMAMCILMGATIDYGILMATTYVQSREMWGKKKSLYKAVSTAMPTVFTSGMILTICGFVIGLISTQNAIATVGFLIGKGTLVSMLMITLVLPSILYLFDDFVLKKGFKGKN